MIGFGRKPVATVAINMRPVRGPWGGSSTAVDQIARCLRARGWAVQYHLYGPVDLVLIIDPREDLQSRAFGMAEIEALRGARPGVRVVHRVNECDQRKGTHFMDGLLEQANRLADHTVFISQWLCEYFRARWFPRERPHSVIYNGADPAVFHPIGAEVWDGRGPIRLLTHHWSDNPLKGFDVYEQVDHLIDSGELEGVELHVIGRWPASIRWRAARTYPPAHGRLLGDLLRQGHLYITGTRWEPCGMHHVEGAQCGMPLLFHADGGGVVEAGLEYGVAFRDDPAAAIREGKARYGELRKRLFASMPSGDRMAHEYAALFQRLVAEAAR